MEVKLALRFMRGRRRSLVRFTSIAALAGIASGVASLIFAQALARGFQSEMQDKILANTPHISVFLPDGAKIDNWQLIAERIEQIGDIRSVSATDHEPALLAGPDSTNYSVLRVKDDLPNKTAVEIQIAVGAELAAKSGLKLGDNAEVIILKNGSMPKTAPARIAEILKTGFFEYDSTWIVISSGDFTKLFGMDTFSPSVLEVSINDIYQSSSTAAKIREQTGSPFRVLDWQEANRPLFAALSLERKAAMVIISLIIFVAMLNIATTLSLLVNERRSDIAVLRTCGALARTVVAMFVIEGLILGLAGLIFGILLGLTACFTANYFRLINLTAEVYLLSYIPLRPSMYDVLMISLFAMVLCLMATIYPSIKAVGIKPLENLRDGA
ncbi:MAG: ABC transporter permease [Saprospiraceae bacterium]|nr:ABC transporter permease [Pyrinomonadaceae bacterium]